MDFQEKFMESKGQPIVYNGKTVMLGDSFKVPAKKSKVHYKFIKTNSEWKQGIEFKVKGKFIINNQVINKGIRLWEHTAPKEGIIEIDSNDDKVDIDNIWDHGDGVTQKWHNGAAMYFEEIPNGKRYYCNDGHPDDDFNDLIFELTIVE